MYVILMDSQCLVDEQAKVVVHEFFKPATMPIVLNMTASSIVIDGTLAIEDLVYTHSGIECLRGFFSCSLFTGDEKEQVPMLCSVVDGRGGTFAG